MSALITILHFTRTVVLTPVPDEMLFIWVTSMHIAGPVAFFKIAGLEEQGRMKMFLVQRDLKLRLGQAERALKFEAPTVQEQEAVATVLHGTALPPGLSSCALPFEELELEERLAAGAFGEVIKATYCGVTVAVKRMLRSRIDKHNMRMFIEEVMLLRKLRHPNVVQFLGASWDSVANICIVLEFVERGSLGELLCSPMPLTWVDPKLKMVTDVASGLSYLHSQHPPVLHRDVKPDNMLVTATFACKVADFGAAYSRQDDATMTMIGTPKYTAPEIVRGDRYDSSVDVFSFSMLLLEVHTHEKPFSGLGLDHIRRAIATDDLPPLPDDMPQALRPLVLTCRSFLPADRPTFPAILSALKQIEKLWIIEPPARMSSGMADSMYYRTDEDDGEGQTSTAHDRNASAEGTEKISQRFDSSVIVGAARAVHCASHDLAPADDDANQNLVGDRKVVGGQLGAVSGSAAVPNGDVQGVLVPKLVMSLVPAGAGVGSQDDGSAVYGPMNLQSRVAHARSKSAVAAVARRRSSTSAHAIAVAAATGARPSFRAVGGGGHHLPPLF